MRSPMLVAGLVLLPASEAWPLSNLYRSITGLWRPHSQAREPAPDQMQNNLIADNKRQGQRSSTRNHSYTTSRGQDHRISVHSRTNNSVKPANHAGHAKRDTSKPKPKSDASKPTPQSDASKPKPKSDAAMRKSNASKLTPKSGTSKPKPRPPSTSGGCVTDNKTMPELLPPRESVHIVVSGCNFPEDPYAWANFWPDYVGNRYDVLVVEKCNASYPPPTEALPWNGRLKLPNVGREAHTFLWYMARYHSVLRPMTVFLQGDFGKHFDYARPMCSLRKKAVRKVLSDLSAFHRGGLSFLSMTDMIDAASTGGFTKRGSLWREVLSNFHNLTVSPQVVTTLLAHFIVSSETIRRQPSQTYSRLVNLFEDDVVANRNFQNCCRTRHNYVYVAQDFGASFFERIWAPAFGCSRLTRRWGRTSNRSEVTTPTSLVPGEASRFSCRSFHPLDPANVTMYVEYEEPKSKRPKLAI